MADRPPPTPTRLISAKAAAGIALTTLLIGGFLGILFDHIAARETAQESVSKVLDRGTLQSLPAGPVSVVAETIVLPLGYEQSQRNGGPTFTFVQRGSLEVVTAGVTTEYGPGSFFFEPGGRAHTIRALENSRIDVLRLLPPGVEATTELG